MKVLIHLKETSQPIIYNDVINAYQKGDFYCVMYMKGNKRIEDKFSLRDKNLFMCREIEEKSDLNKIEVAK